MPAHMRGDVPRKGTGIINVWPVCAPGHHAAKRPRAGAARQEAARRFPDSARLLHVWHRP